MPQRISSLEAAEIRFEGVEYPASGMVWCDRWVAAPGWRVAAAAQAGWRAVSEEIVGGHRQRELEATLSAVKFFSGLLVLFR
jgi:hypothetical protein